MVEVVKWTLTAASSSCGLGQGDPVSGAGHRQSPVEPVEDDVAVLDELAAAAPAVATRAAAFARTARPAVAGVLAARSARRCSIRRRRRTNRNRTRRDPSSSEALVARRSFLAQPEPLKWMVGGVERLLDGAPAADRAGRGRVRVDAVDDLEPGRRRRRSRSRRGARRRDLRLSRAGGACRTWGSRTPARAPRRSRNGRRPGRRGRRPASAARRPSGPSRTGWPGCS